MRLRLRFVLPISQVIVAAAALAARYKIYYHLRYAPENELCHGLNAPASLVVYFLVHTVDALGGRFGFPRGEIRFLIETLGFLFLVGVLWYLIVLKVDSVRGGLPRIANSSATLAMLVDGALIAYGTALGVAGIMIAQELAFEWPSIGYRSLVAALYVAWGMLFILFYGRDLLAQIKAKHLGSHGPRN